MAAVEETRGEGGGTFDPGGTDPGPREASWMAGLERDLFGEVDGDPDQLAAAAVEGEPNQTPQPVPQPVEEPHPPEVPPPAPEPPPPSYPSEAPQPPQPVEVPPVIPERREAVADSDVEEFDDDGDIRKEPRLF